MKAQILQNYKKSVSFYNRLSRSLINSIKFQRKLNHNKIGSIDKFIFGLHNAPRIGSLADMFMDIASGKVQVPNKIVTPNSNWLKKHDKIKLIYALHKEQTGIFHKHFYASVPYSLELALSMTNATFSYSLNKFNQSNTPLNFFEPGGASGDFSEQKFSKSSGGPADMGHHDSLNDDIPF